MPCLLEAGVIVGIDQGHGGEMDLLHRIVGDPIEIYERQLGTTAVQVRDQEERVHARAGELAEAARDSRAPDGPKIVGDTVQVLSHNSEDREQDQIHYQAANLAHWRTL